MAGGSLADRAGGDRRPVVPIHPEPVAGHPELMVWVLPAGTFAEAGPVLHAPGEFGAMLAEGLLVYAIVQPGGGQLLVRLRPGAAWRDTGGRVRTALHAALAEPDRWMVSGAAPATVPAGGAAPAGAALAGVSATETDSRGAAPARSSGAALASSGSGGGESDELLREAAGAVLAGEFGEYVRSHGGGVEVLDVSGGIVSIRFHGECHGCPAAAITMHVRFERELRARCPILVSVRSR